MTNRICIVTCSYHHGNTLKVVEGIEEKLNSRGVKSDRFDLLNGDAPDVIDYDLFIFASGIYAFGIHRDMVDFVGGIDEQKILDPYGQGTKIGKKAYVVYTCGMEKGNWAGKFKNLLRNKGFVVLGSSSCLGFDTFGPLKLLGGLNKERPNEEDVKKVSDEVMKGLNFYLQRGEDTV